MKEMLETFYKKRLEDRELMKEQDLKSQKIADRLDLVETTVYNRDTNGRTKFDDIEERMRDMKITLSD